MEILDSYPLNEKQDGCCTELDPRKDPQECVSIVSMVTTMCGVLLALIGYAAPRNYDIDMAVPAREMEQTEQDYVNLSDILDVCLIVGFGLVLIGFIGFLTILVYNLTSKECHETCFGRDSENVIYLTRMNSRFYYGSTEKDEIPIMDQSDL